jgi:cysteine desulfurase
MMRVERRVYLDHSASTPVDRRVLEAMLPYFTDVYGNPSSMHQYGRAAEHAVEGAREQIAQILNCQPNEIVFTSGGSEGDSLAIKGVIDASNDPETRPHVVTSSIEHDAILETVRGLADSGQITASVLPVSRLGEVDSLSLSAALTAQTTVASVVYANNEVGTIQDVAGLAAVAHDRQVIFHSDAVQAGGQLTLDVHRLGVDLMTLAAHKFYGPKGVGILYIRQGIDVLPQQRGGGQEFGKRAGTHNTPLIVGMATALRLAYEELEFRQTHLRLRRDQLIVGILQAVDGIQLTGHPERRLPSHSSFVIEDVQSEALLMHLDVLGIAASSGSACKVGNPEPSSVLLAMGYSAKEALGSLRLTVGLHTSEADVAFAVQGVAEAVRKVRQLKGVWVT